MKDEFDLEKSRFEVKRKLANIEGRGDSPKITDRKFDFIDNLVIGISFFSMVAYFLVLEFGNFSSL